MKKLLPFIAILVVAVRNLHILNESDTNLYFKKKTLQSFISIIFKKL